MENCRNLVYDVKNVLEEFCMWKGKKQEKNPNEYWKGKGFDSNEEFLIYQYLCGNLRKKNKISEEKRFNKYKSWCEHVEEIIENYDKETLSEFFHFVELRRRQCDIDIGMHTSIFIPLVVAVIASGFVGSILEVIKNPSTTTNVSESYNSDFLVIILSIIIFLILMIILVFGLVFILYNIIDPYIKSKNETSFWEDCLVIVRNKMKEDEK